MLLTEKEALNKRCWKTLCLQESANRWVSNICIGSRCAAWRWAQKIPKALDIEIKREDRERIKFFESDSDWFKWSNNKHTIHFKEKKPESRRFGYCGLAGVPTDHYNWLRLE